jgi:fatty-acyl-CoA synthase
MTIDDWVTRGANCYGDKTAIEFASRALTYQDFARLIDRQVQVFHEKDIRHGDRIAWYGLNNPKVFILLFACARIGAIFVPLNWRLAEKEVREIVENCSPRLIYTDDKFTNAAADLPLADISAPTKTKATSSDPLLIVYTSGSTGKPKGVVLSQDALISNAEMSIHAHGLVPADRVLNVLPLFHVGGLNILPTPAFSLGATVVLHSVFEPTAMLYDLETVQAAITVPTVLGALLSHPDWSKADFSKLRCMSIGSTDVPVELIEQVHARGVPMLQIYGATETSPFAIYQTYKDAMATVGSIGRKGTCGVRLVQSDGTDAPVGTPGEILIKGTNTLLEYWQSPELTVAGMQNGWFKSGDVATLDSDGQYSFNDRIKHIIFSGGENIFPAEIERILRRHPEIAEISVVGVPDPKWGQTPVVVAVQRGNTTEKDLLDMLQGILARYKHPKRIVFVDALPRNAMGKVMKDAVRDLVS